MIPAAAFAFLRGLAANNEKAWFEASRATYDSAVREPVAALVAAVAASLADRDVPLGGDAKRSVFRIHRDVRFSKDKRPYKTNVGVFWYRSGGGGAGNGVLYLHIDPGQCFAGVAFYRPEPEILDRIRERIRVHPDRFLAVEAALAQAKLRLSREDALSRMPKGFEDLKASPVADALRLKSYLVRRPLTDGQVQGKALVRTLVDLAETALPLLHFGWAAIDEGEG